MKKRLLISKKKITYRIINGKKSKEEHREIGEQLINNEYALIKEKNNDCNSLEGLNCDNKELENDNNVFNFILALQNKYCYEKYVSDVAIEETIVQKLHNNKFGSEKYYTVVYNIFNNAINKRIANEFMVFECLNNETIECVSNRIRNEIIWNDIDKIKCENISKQWIFAAQAAGFFFHECIGHLLEEEQFRISRYSIGDYIFDSDIDVFENWEVDECLDDYDQTIEKKICLISNGQIRNVLTANMEGGSGNACTQEPFIEPMSRMNDMYVRSNNPIEDELDNVKDGIYIEEITCGEYNPINGEIGLSISKSYQIVSGIKTVGYKPMSILFSLNDLIGNNIDLNNKYEKIMSLCGKYGAVKKIKYNVPEMRIDWRRNGKFITDRDF